MTRRLEQQTQRAIDLHLRSRSMVFLEAAVSMMLVRFSVAEVKKVLRDYADHLEEFG